MRKPKNSLLRFLKTSIENKLVLTTAQIQIIQPNLTKDEIAGIVAQAHWSILEQKEENDATAYTLIDISFVCICGKPPIHYHEERTAIACCGGEGCCPDVNDSDIEVQIAENLVSIRRKLEQRAVRSL